MSVSVRICRAKRGEGSRDQVAAVKINWSPRSTSNTNKKPAGREAGGLVVIASAFWRVPQPLTVTLSDRSAPGAVVAPSDPVLHQSINPDRNEVCGR